ncbi:hypothetical protein [Poriferisphaera sp. WC338]|uniref:hypothetical protein n=1 Tax=Poriferisphaera sp. WC338 TaxID=3425129 RepID=UPI003D8195FF
MGDENSQQEVRGLVSGKKVFLLTLLVCVVVPFMGVGVALWYAGGLVGVSAEKTEEVGFAWGSRRSWPALPVKQTKIEYKPGHKPPFEGRVRRNLDFSINADDLAEIKNSSQAVMDFFVSRQDEAAYSTAMNGIEKEPEQRLFYTDYVQSHLVQLVGNDDELGDRLRKRAFEKAPAAIVLRFVDASGRPVAGETIEPIEIVCAQVSNRVVDQGVRLLYPAEKTDENGYIYLPVYDTVLRFSRRPEIKGVKVDLGIVRWFEFPGRVGLLEATVTRLDKVG